MKNIRPILKKEIIIDRFTIPFRVYGEKGPHLICLNGAQQSMAMWHDFVSIFSKYYKIVLFNFPGLGKARILSDPRQLTLQEQVNILDAMLKEAQLNQQTTICTASWGGVIALAFAAQHPRSIKRLILGSIGLRPNQRMVDTIQKGVALDTKDRSEMAAVLINSFGQKLPDKIKKMIQSQFRTMTEENLQAFSKHGLFVISANKLTDMVDLNNIQAETLILRGEHDTIIDLEDVYALADKIPNCQVKVINDIGHFMHLETEHIFDVYKDALEGNYI